MISNTVYRKQRATVAARAGCRLANPGPRKVATSLRNSKAIAWVASRGYRSAAVPIPRNHPSKTHGPASNESFHATCELETVVGRANLPVIVSETGNLATSSANVMWQPPIRGEYSLREAKHDILRDVPLASFFL